MEVVGHSLLDLCFEFGVFVNFGTNVRLEFILDEIFERFNDQIFGGHQLLELRLEAAR